MQFFYGYFGRRIDANRSKLDAAAPTLVIAGAILLLLASGFWLHEALISHRADHAAGTITDLEARRDPDGNVNYYPQVRFTLPNGQFVQFTSPHGSNPASFNAGDPVPIAYPPGKPATAVIATRWMVYTASIILAILGILLFDLGFYFQWLINRSLRRAAKVT
jgi:hypothetical protein